MRSRVPHSLTAVVLWASLGMVGCQFSDRLSGSLQAAVDIAGGESGTECPPFEGQVAADAAGRPNASIGSQTDCQSELPSRDDVRAVLAQPTWFVRIPDHNAADTRNVPRWRHPGLEDLLARPPSLRPDFAQWLDDPDPTVAGNAAIAQARLGIGHPVAHLAAAVRRPEMNLAMRRAAVECLANFPHRSPCPNSRGLLGNMADDPAGPDRASYRNCTRNSWRPWVIWHPPRVGHC